MIFRQFSSVTEDTQLNYIYILNSINRRDEKEKTRGTIAKIDPEQYRTTTAATRIAVILVAHLMRVTHGWLCDRENNCNISFTFAIPVALVVDLNFVSN